MIFKEAKAEAELIFKYYKDNIASLVNALKRNGYVDDLQQILLSIKKKD